MEFELTVHAVLPVVTGQSARGEWKKQEVIFEMPGEFNRKLCVGFWNDRAAEAAALLPGDRVALSVNVESREYNGRWYTEVRAWRMSRLESAAPAGAPMPADFPPASAYAAESTTTAQPAASSAAEVDDLPF